MKKKNKKRGSTNLTYKLRCMWFVNKLTLEESLFLKDCVIKHIQQINDGSNKTRSRG